MCDQDYTVFYHLFSILNGLQLAQHVQLLDATRSLVMFVLPKRHSRRARRKLP